MKHFKLRKDLSITHAGKTLYRIEATEDSLYAKKGQIGGYVEKEDNLNDEAWVSHNAMVYVNAIVSDSALVSGNAGVYGTAQIYGRANVFGNAQVYDNANVFGNATVCGNAKVYGRAKVCGNARVFGDELVEMPTDCIFIGNLKHHITITKKHIAIGCELHTIRHWKRNIVKIGKNNAYSDKEIKAIISILKGAMAMRGY